MKRLFIYYSRSGNGDLVAEMLKEKGFDIEKVETLKNPIPKSFVLSMFIGGFKAAIGAHPKIKELVVNPELYDEIYIGSPIWNARFATPTNSLLKELKLEGKKVTFVLYSGSGTSKGATKKINKLYPEARIINLKEPLKYKEEAANKLSF